MILYLILGLLAVIAISALLKKEECRKPLTLAVAIVVGIAAVILLMRIGLSPLIALGGFLLSAIPYMGRFTQFLFALRLLARLRRSAKHAQNSTQHPTSQSNMNEEEARQILGVSATASKEEIKNKYQQLMKLNHPDKGGSDYIASKLNQAKDTLL